MWAKKALLFMLIVSLCFSTDALARTRDRGLDEKEYKKIDALFLKGDYKGASEESGKFLKDFPRSRNKKEVMYIQGLSCLKLGDYARAKEAFNELIRRSGGILRQEAYLGLGDAHFLSGEYRQAVLVYKDFLRYYPASDVKSSVYSRMADAYNRLGDKQEADIYVRKLASECGESVEKTLTKTQFAKIEAERPEEADTYSVQVGYFSDFKNAQKLYQKLLRQKYTAYLQKENTSKGTFYRVRVGSFDTRWKAQKFAKKLSKSGYQTKVYP